MIEGGAALSADAASAIDQQMIAALSDLGGDELVTELVHMFLDDSRQRIEDLADAIEAGDSATTAFLAHTFKSSSANLGAMNLAAICHDLEIAARAESPGEYGAALALLRSEFALVAPELGRLAGDDRRENQK